MGRLIAVGASTGGVEALEKFVVGLPANAPPVAITLHIPKRYSGAFAERLNKRSALRVTEAEDGAILEHGTAVVAPGNMHLRVNRVGGRYKVMLGDDGPVSRHKPSVDALFLSVAKAAGPQGVGVILTGMGADGAQGLKAMRETGALTFGQSAESCVVYGMPKEAKRRGAVGQEMPLWQLSKAVQVALQASQAFGGAAKG